MRTRIRPNHTAQPVVSGPWHVEPDKAGDCHRQTWPGASTYYNEEVCEDDPTLGSGYVAKPVRHEKRPVVVYPQFVHTHYTTKGWAEERVSKGYETWAPPYFPSSVRPDWNQLVLQVSDRLENRLKTRATAGVFLAELIQTVRMVTNPFGLLSTLVRGKARQSPLKRLASGHLEYSFGWAQLFRDIEAFAKAYVSVERAASQLPNPRSGQSHACSARVTIDVEPSTFNQSRGFTPRTYKKFDSLVKASGDSNNNLYPYRFLWCRSAKYVAVVSVLDTPSPIAGVSRVQALLQAFGLTSRDLLPLLWEIVPYSFVVDWFVNLGGFLTLPSVLKARRKLNRLPIHRVCYSQKIVCEYNALACNRRVAWRDIPMRDNYAVAADASRGSVYERKIGLPPLTSLEASGSLTVTQLGLTASLIAQRIL